ncbi:DUF6259 domain-containing protein [Changchengzhania lutea]|uniref:DUF6259 domain-containing protein n=1 Tax=Changchengzhania lutea TaxID=2049305 RepID=UPI00115CD7CC|nr:DUF6259 domain-containing protein [Changchengzhania lutea]
MAFFCFFACKQTHSEQNITIENGKIELGFDAHTGALLVFRNIDNSYNFLDSESVPVSLWEVELFNNSETKTIDMTNASDFNFEKRDAYNLVLTWDKFKEIKNEDFKIIANIKLEKDKTMSSWKITVEGTKGKKISKVVFPIISGIKDLGDENLAVPNWMGVKAKNPRDRLLKLESKEKKYQWEYPGRMSMQCIALYNDSKKFGLYTSCNDSLAYKKSFSYTLDSINNLTYKIANYPSIDKEAKSYSPPYEAIIGSFDGDWISAADIYREWGSKQKWASESRFKKGLTPQSLEKTALWEWNRGESDNVLKPAEDLKQKLGLPVNVFWHWWHGCSYDDGFPEYFPPREGEESFIKAMKSAHKEDVGAIVYMNQMQWGTNTESWEEEHAERYAVKDINGNLNTHLYNVFTGKSLTTMCMGTQFWKDRYTSLCDTAVNTYQTNGVYMDQACFSFLCYDDTHGHDVGGGNYWLKNFAILTQQIRSKFPKGKDIFLAGEGVSEAWLPYLDAFLTLQVSMERYAGDSGWEPIPFFQAVYHQFAITYGNYSSLLIPPYDELWPKEYAPKEPLKLLDESYSKQFLMEQARSFVWGLQPTISNYQSFLSLERKEEIDYLLSLARVRYRGLKYLLHGKFLRPPVMEFPKEELHMSRLSIYAGKTGESVTTFQKEYPLIYSGAWKSDDNQIGIPIASISDHPYRVDFSMDTKDYALSASGKINIINEDGENFLTTYTDGKVKIDFILQPKQLCIVEIIQSI